MTKKANLPPPTEEAEQRFIFEWAARMAGMYPELELLAHVTNEGKRTKATGGRLVAAGLKKGFPDIVLPLSHPEKGGLYIELKRAEGGTVTSHQKRWLYNLFRAGNTVAICYGAEEAILVLCEYLGIQPPVFGRNPWREVRAGDKVIADTYDHVCAWAAGLGVAPMAYIPAQRLVG